MQTEVLEMRGIPRKYFVQYFYDIGGTTNDESTFNGDFWQVTLSEEKWTKTSVLKIQSTEITFIVNNDRLDEFIHQFRLKFLRGGG